MCLAPQRRAIFRQFFDICTSKSGPRPSVFYDFDLKMCLSLQRRAIFQHRNFKKWSAPDSFLAFWLENVLLATAACNFSTSQLQKVVRTWHVFVHFDLKMCFSLQRRAIFPHRNFKKWSEHVARGTFWLKMCFSLQRRAIFHVFPQQPPPHPPLYRGYFSTQPTHKSLKNTAFRDFPNISRNCSFFLLTFAQLYLLSSDSTSLLCFFIFWLCYSALLFQLSILSEVRLLNFLRLKYCSSTTEYYPSNTLYYKAAFMIDPWHIWTVIYNARSNKSHPPTSPNTAPAKKNDSHVSWLLLVTYETSFTMRGATLVSIQHHQILRLPWNSMKFWVQDFSGKSLNCFRQYKDDSTTIRAWNRHLAPAASETWLVPSWRRITTFRALVYLPKLNEMLHLPNTAPATQNESHEWSASDMKRHLQCTEQQESPSNCTKYCACHAKSRSW